MWWRSTSLTALLAIATATYSPAQTSFSEERLIATEVDGPHRVVAADLDGDSDLDIVATIRFDNSIVWSENDGSGNFGPVHLIHSNVQAAIDVLTADLDGDGDLDVAAVGIEDNSVYWFENDGTVDFGFKIIIADNVVQANSMYAADLDADGDVDLLVAELGGDTISWFENNGTGEFGEAKIISSDAEGATFVSAADLDGDCDEDVIAALSYGYQLGGSFVWYENDGAGSFGPPMTIAESASEPRTVLPSDLDGDSDADIVTSSFSPGEIAWYLNNGSGEFPESGLAREGSQAVFAEASDLDNDGDLDILRVIQDEATVGWYENDGSGNFSALRVIEERFESAGTSSVHAADIDADGDFDVLTSNFREDKIGWYENLLGDNPVTREKVLNGDLARDLQLLAYPNPARDHITLEIPGLYQRLSQITIFDLVGRKIKNVSLQTAVDYHRVRIPLREVPSGIYVLRLTSGSTITSLLFAVDK